MGDEIKNGYVTHVVLECWYRSAFSYNAFKKILAYFMLLLPKKIEMMGCKKLNSSV